MKQASAWLAAVFGKHDLDLEFEAEIQSHITLATEDYLQRGMAPAEARRMARVKFGAVEASKDFHRDARGLPGLEGLYYDLRFALRGLRRDRGFTLAIGLNVTVFTVMNTMLFRSFPLVKRNDRLLYMQERYPSGLFAYLTRISRPGDHRRTLLRIWRLWRAGPSPSATEVDGQSICPQPQ